MQLTLDLTQEPEDGIEEFPDDEIYISLQKRMEVWNDIDFKDMVHNCSEALNTLQYKVKNRVLVMNMEGFKEMIEAFWKALKNFFVKLGSILMFWKKKVTTFYDSAGKEITKYTDIANTLKGTSKYDPMIASGLRYTFHLDRARHGSNSYGDRWDDSGKIVSDMPYLFNNIKRYIDDPELNDVDGIDELEVSNDVISFRRMLGVQFYTNIKEPLTESRIVRTGAAAQYDVVRVGEQVKFSALVNLNDPRDINNTIGSCKIRLSDLGTIINSSLVLHRMMDDIDKNYKVMEDGLKWKVQSQLNTDPAELKSRGIAVKKAKDHIVKSKILIEEFTVLVNIECNNTFNMIKGLYECMIK